MWSWTLKCKEMSLWHPRDKIGEGQDDSIDQQSMKQVSLVDGCDISGQLDNFRPSKCPQCSEAPQWLTSLHLENCIFPCCFPFSFPNSFTEAPLQGWLACFRAGLCDRKVLNSTASLVYVNVIENDKSRNTEMRITASAPSSNTHIHDNK